MDDAATYLYSTYFDSSYFLEAVAILLSFLFGCGLGKAVKKAKPSIADYGSLKISVPKILALSFGVLVVYFAVLASTSGARFFTGYSTYDIAVLGPECPCAGRPSTWR